MKVNESRKNKTTGCIDILYSCHIFRHFYNSAVVDSDITNGINVSGGIYDPSAPDYCINFHHTPLFLFISICYLVYQILKKMYHSFLRKSILSFFKFEFYKNH